MLVRLALAAFVTAAAVSPAAAQGLRTEAADWSGRYATIFAGGLQSDGSVRLDDNFGPLITLDVENGLFPLDLQNTEVGLLGGIGIGYNVQRDAFVFGVEADFALTDTRVDLRYSRIDPNPNPIFNGVETNTSYLTDFSNLASLRLRAGYATGQTLLYATGGLAAGRVTNRFTLELPNLVVPGLIEDGYRSPDLTAEGTRTGYIVGAGVEQRLAPTIGLRAEVMHFDLSDVTIRGRDETVFPGEGLDYRFRNSGQVARIGLSVRF
jgi:outer membrane immunogenic protein